MVFSKQTLESAFTYLHPYYDKVIFVDGATNRFNPIKVNDDEWKLVKGYYNRFSEWVREFKQSSYIHPDDRFILSEFYVYWDSYTKPVVFRYRKLINDEYHEVELEFIPIGNKQAYIFVKDLDSMRKEIKIDE